MKRVILFFFFLNFLFFVSCVDQEKKVEIHSLGNQSISIFDSTNLYFDIAFKADTTMASDSILRLDAGRVLLKKVKLPKYKLQPEVYINARLTSNGDPWDKSGSLFVIPKETDLSLLDFESGEFDLKNLSETYPGVKPFDSASLKYFPTVELLRFMTPFGVGFFNDKEVIKERKPIYIPEWEEDVQWKQEITQLLPLLEDEVYIGVYIDTWTKEGYNISASLEFKETEISNHLKKETCVVPLINTVKYAADQRQYDDFAINDLEVNFVLDSTYSNVQLHYITTGHGGHAEGDEFKKEENQIYLDNKLIKSFIPWRDDCASFRRFNPTTGVWEQDVIWDGEESTERLASSDLSRSNWCPGSDVSPEIIPLKMLKKGAHTLKISIPEAQKAAESENNYWMVSAYLTYEK